MKTLKRKETNFAEPHSKTKPWQYLVSALILFVFLMPLYVLLMRSFKPITDMTSFMSVPQSIYWDNYLTIIRNGSMFRAYMNSGIITLSTLAIEVSIACMAAYPLARNKTRTNTLIGNVFLGIMMIPPLTILVGVYSFAVRIQAINTRWGLIFTLVAFGLPLSIFLFTNFIRAIPNALDEASFIDGANVVQTFFQIIFPQLKPIVTTVFILHGVMAWNEYAYSMYLLQSPKLMTITLTIKQYFTINSSDYGGSAAAAMLAILPLIIVYIVLQDSFVRGQVDSAIK